MKAFSALQKISDVRERLLHLPGHHPPLIAILTHGLHLRIEHDLIIVDAAIFVLEPFDGRLAPSLRGSAKTTHVTASNGLVCLIAKRLSEDALAVLRKALVEGKALHALAAGWGQLETIRVLGGVLPVGTHAQHSVGILVCILAMNAQAGPVLRVDQNLLRVQVRLHWFHHAVLDQFVEELAKDRHSADLALVLETNLVDRRHHLCLVVLQRLRMRHADAGKLAGSQSHRFISEHFEPHM